MSGTITYMYTDHRVTCMLRKKHNATNSNQREYEDADSVGIERMVKTIPTDTSSSDDESLGSSTPSTSKVFL